VCIIFWQSKKYFIFVSDLFGFIVSFQSTLPFFNILTFLIFFSLERRNVLLKQNPPQQSLQPTDKNQSRKGQSSSFLFCLFFCFAVVVGFCWGLFNFCNFLFYYLCVVLA